MLKRLNLFANCNQRCRCGYGECKQMRSSMACYSLKWRRSIACGLEVNLVASSNTSSEVERNREREKASIFHKCVNAFRDRIKAVCTTALIHYSVRFATAPCNSHKYTGIFDCKKTTLTAPLRVLPMALSDSTATSTPPAAVNSERELKMDFNQAML